jgi:hypothetical protein
VISIVILWAHGKKGHGAHFRAPMSLIRRSLSAILYIDDTDLDTYIFGTVVLEKRAETWPR